MPYEHCGRGDCARPSEKVVVIVVVSLIEGDQDAPMQLPLCADHAETLLYLARRSATR